MNSKEFVIWLKGFTEGVHEFNITPKQWDLMKEKLAEVEDSKFVETPGMLQVHPQPAYPGVPLGVPNTWQHPHYVDPFNPYKVTCRGPETPTGTTITTTPGTGYITVANPNIASFGTGSLSTSTATALPSGTTITYTVTTGSGLGVGTTYTTNESPNWYSINKIENDSREK
jgi:hypothetical protein